MDESSVSRQLDMITLPISKHFRYPLPVPEKFLEEAKQSHMEDSSLVSSPYKNALRSTETSPLKTYGGASFSSGTQEKEDGIRQMMFEEYQTEMKEAARQACLKRIHTFTQWQDQIEKSLKDANESSQILVDVLSGIRAMRAVTETVQEQHIAVTRDTSGALAKMARQELLRDEIRKVNNHFLRIDNLFKEVQNPLLSAVSERFPLLLEDVEKEALFLSQSTSLKSYKEYHNKLAIVQQSVAQCVTNAVKSSLDESVQYTRNSIVFKRALNPSMTETSPEEEEVDLPVLNWDNMEDSFANFLNSVNRLYLAKMEEKTSLRRMLEMRGGSSKENSLLGSTSETDLYSQEVLNAYRTGRVSIVGPLLRRWLTVWYNQNVNIHSGPFSLPKPDENAVSESPKSPSDIPTERSVSLLPSAPVDRTLPEITFQMCSFLEVCLEAEKEILEEVWLRDEFVSYLMPQLVASIAEEVYHGFRSRLLRVDSIEELSDTIKAIQRIQLTHDTKFGGATDITTLWTRMIQDAQERLFFRTSVYLRESVVNCKPKRTDAQAYLKLTDSLDKTTSEVQPLETVPCNDPAFYWSGVLNAIKLLALLYPTLEFSVFSVFAEESIQASLALIQELTKLMQKETSDPEAPTKALLCQLAHLLFLRRELSHIDASIMVVESSLDFTKLRQRRLEIVQSKRDSKQDVEGEFVTCVDRLTQTMLTSISQPLTGTATKEAAVRAEAVEKMHATARRCASMIPVYVSDKEVEEQIMRPVLERCKELEKDASSDAK
ncbi:hypothetical protein AGDE_12417 [Angomonas deanei]|nr:hypothetical protein AGDE_12417 [Angomonas deanei]|eukprot:EPY24299.1 hypothetical protein AGDE_12417 [Angomonas deanei]